MRTLKAMWSQWQHGAWLTLAYGIGLLGAALLVCIPGTLLLGWLWGLSGRTSILLLSPIWVPLGLGWTAKELPSDRLKPEGYVEHEGRLGRLARKLKQQG